MADERDARVKLELAAGGMLSMLRMLEKQAKELADKMEGVGEKTEKAEKKISPALASMKKGLGEAKKSLGEVGSTIKSTLGQAATLGGALSLGHGVTQAVQLQNSYRQVAHSIERATGKAVAWQDVQ